MPPTNVSEVTSACTHLVLGQLLSAIQSMDNDQAVNQTLRVSELQQVLESLLYSAAPPHSTKPNNGLGALMYIICVMVFFAAPMIILIVRYLWGERESSKMEAFYSRIIENKPPRMILFDYNGRRLSKPELLTPSPNRKVTLHGIPYHDSFYSPSNYKYRSSLTASPSTASCRSSAVSDKHPTIYLSEHKWRRWLSSLSSSAASPVTPETKLSFVQANQPVSPDIFLTPSTPPTESQQLTMSPFSFKPIVLWKNFSSSASSDGLTSRIHSKLSNLGKETFQKSDTKKEGVRDDDDEQQQSSNKSSVSSENMDKNNEVEPAMLKRKQCIIPSMSVCYNMPVSTENIHGAQASGKLLEDDEYMTNDDFGNTQHKVTAIISTEMNIDAIEDGSMQLGRGNTEPASINNCQQNLQKQTRKESHL